MSEQTRELRKELLDSLSPSTSNKENPLRTIGLSEQILEIGLTDDELYDYCRYQARYLTAQFHRDRPEMRTGAALEKQHRYEEAFNVIKSDRETFDRALGEFRVLRSAERSAENFLRRSLQTTRDKLGSYQNRETEMARAEVLVGQKLDKAETTLADAERIKTQEAERVNSLNEDISRITSLLSRQENMADEYRDRYNHLLRYLTSLSTEEPKGVHILDIKWVLIATLVWKDDPRIKPVRRGTKFWGKAGGLNLPAAQVKTIQARWEDLLKRFPRKSEKAQITLRNGLIRVSNCRVEEVLGLPTQPKDSCLLGSIEKTPSEIRTLRKPIDRREVFKRIHPWVVPGEAIVLQKFWRLSDNRSMENQTNPQPLFDWDTSQIILAVGK